MAEVFVEYEYEDIEDPDFFCYNHGLPYGFFKNEV